MATFHVCRVQSLLCSILVFGVLCHGQTFTEWQKNGILQWHKQRLAEEALRMFENQFRPSATDANPIFHQLVNYKGLYENLDIRNVSVSVLDGGCHPTIDPLVGFDYQRHRSRHFLACFSTNGFVVRTFRLDHGVRQLFFDDQSTEMKPVPGQLLQVKLFRRHDTDQLFLLALILKGVHQIRVYEVIDDGPKIVDKELLYDFKLNEPVSRVDVVHCDYGKQRIVALIDSGRKTLDNFLVQTDPAENENAIIRVTVPHAFRLRTMRIQSQGFIVVANTTHWAAYRYRDGHAELVSMFQMRYAIRDIQVFSNGHRYYVGVAAYQEQYIYQWKDKQGFRGVAKMQIPMVYKMNAITISYSREDNFFYFDQIQSDSVSIYGYDITNSMFVHLRTFYKRRELNLSPEMAFHPLYSVNFYDRNFAYELKIANPHIYLFAYETDIANYDVTGNQRRSNGSLHHLQRYNRDIYERKIEKMTKTVLQLDRQETISKFVANLTFTFNVTFRGNVRVNRLYVTDGSRMPKRVNINRRDYAFDELNVSMSLVQRQVEWLSRRMDGLRQRLQQDVVYRDQNADIPGRKDFINRFFAKKIYAKQTQIDWYRRRDVGSILSNLYRLGSNVPVTGRKTFLSDVHVKRSFQVYRINGMQPNDFLYTDQDQDVYSAIWYRQVFADQMAITGGRLTGDVSLARTIFINQNDQPIAIRNKLVFDSIDVDNLYVDGINSWKINELTKRVLNRHVQHRQVIRVPTKIAKIHAKTDVEIGSINSHNVTRTLANVLHRNGDLRFDVPVQFYGDVHIVGALTVNGRINEVNVPGDLMDRHSDQVVYGTKRFASVVVENLNVTYLNRLNIPADIVTLSGDDEIHRPVTLDTLHVTGNVLVEGLVDGVNLTHLDQRFIESFQNNYKNLTFLKPVNVTRLTVNGPINGLYLDHLNRETFLKHERILVVPSKKVIATYLKCDNIVANTINGHVLDNFVATTDRAIFSNRFVFTNGVNFQHVNLAQTIDNVDVQRLFKDIVTLNTDQTMVGDKRFMDGITVLDSLVVHGKINDQWPQNWLLYGREQNVTGPIRFVEATTANLLIGPGGTGNVDAQTINGMNFSQAASNLIYMDRPNSLNAMIRCINCSASNVVTENFNGQNLSHFLANYLSRSRPQTIPAPKRFLSDQYFHDIQTTNGIAGFDMRTLKYNAITRDGYNIITNPVVIHGDLKLIRGQLNADRWNGINIEKFTNEIVRRDSHERIQVQGDVIYQADVDLLTDIRVHKLNRYAPEEIIMTADGNHTIESNVVFEKKVIVTSDRVTVTGTVNSLNLTEFERDALKTNERGELIAGELNIVEPFWSDEIIVEGLVDEIPLSNDTILMADKVQNIKQLVIDGNQWFNGSINVMSQINHRDKDDLHKIVLVSSPEEQMIDFQKVLGPVDATEIRHADGFINIKMINHVDLVHFNSNVVHSLADRTIKVRQKFFDNITINGAEVKVIGLINGVKLADVVRLDRVKQTITGHKIFDDIVFNEDVDVRGLINTVDVPALTKNMFLVYGNQRIQTPLAFLAPMYVMSNSTVERLNQFNPSDLVTVHGDHTINGTMQFNNLLVPNVHLKGHLVNGINLTDVAEHGFFTDGPSEQVFDGSLVLDQAWFQQNVTLADSLNGIDLSQTVQDISNKFDPKIDSQSLMQELQNNDALIYHHKKFYSYAHLEIEYFFRSNVTTLNAGYFEMYAFQNRFQLVADSIHLPLYESLYKRRKWLWQIIRIPGEARLYVTEMWPQQHGDVFRLVSLDLATGQSWNLIEMKLDPGTRPFLFSMDHHLYLVYINGGGGDDETCWRHPIDQTKLFRLDVDMSQLSAKLVLFQNFIEHSIRNVGHYHQDGLHYLMFNVHDYGMSKIVVYQRSGSPACRFQWFQTIPMGNIRQISLFTMGISPGFLEPYVALLNDTHLAVWKQEGINGFTKSWFIRTGYRRSATVVDRQADLFPFVQDDRRFMFYLNRMASGDCLESPTLFYEARFNQELYSSEKILLYWHEFI